MPPEITINGTPEPIAGFDPCMTLLQYLRASGRTGTKEGCAEGDCGACTVALVETAGRFQAVNSCLLPLAAACERSVVTVEGVALDRDTLHPVQEALVATGGSQCGYCTPGFVMSMFSAYYDQDGGDEAVEGNLCRCTGYLPIRRAAASLGAPSPDDPHLRASDQPGGSSALARSGNRTNGLVEHLGAAGTEFFVPRSLEAAVTLLAEREDAIPIAGATDLGVDITKFHRRFPQLVSLEHVPELHVLEHGYDEVVIGGAVPLTRVERTLHGTFPALDEMLRWFAARQIRNRATIGGNLGTASPIGDLAPVLLALDAQIELASVRGRRLVAIDAYFHGYRETERRRDELIATVRIPTDPLPGTARRHAQSYKVGKRGTDDISIVAACFRIDLDERDRIRAARLAYGGVAATPARARAVESDLIGRAWDAHTAQRAGTALQDAFTPLDDHRGSAAYRRRLAGNLFEKFWHEHRSPA